VLRGGVHIGFWFIPILSVIGPLILIVLNSFDYTIHLIITVLIVWLSLNLPLFIVLTRFIVISS